MNFRVNVDKINVDKIITVLVTIAILIYVIIIVIKQVNFNDFKFNYMEEIVNVSIANYIENNENYYYKIEGSIYCITKEELRNSGKINYEVLDNMTGSVIEAKYENGYFDLKYNDNCIEK